MKKLGYTTFVGSIWQGLRLELPLYPWFNNKTKQVYSKNVFREMQRFEVTWLEAERLLDRAHNLRNELMEENLGNSETYLVRNEQRFAFSIIHGKIIYDADNCPMSGRIGGRFALWDDFDRSIGHYEIEDVTTPPTDEFILWIEQETARYCEGLIPCSGCGTHIKQEDIAGRYFAGIYCKKCWEGGMKEIEARETYD